jgi:hypothetical protein
VTTAPKDETIVDTLARYSQTLRARVSALEALLQTNVQILNALKATSTPDIGDLLERRDADCKLIADTGLPSDDNEESLLALARAAVGSSSRNVSTLARRVLADRDRAQELAVQIMTTQSECETLLKRHLQAAAAALRKSARKRQLSAAYGPAMRENTPAFMDHQR